MDRFGRVWVAVPGDDRARPGLRAAAADLRRASTIGLVAALMGLGNGISAGIVMTLGADAGPGRRAGPVPRRLAVVRRPRQRRSGRCVISAVTVRAPAWPSPRWTMGGLTWLGSAWLAKWVPAYAPTAPRRRAVQSSDGRTSERP